MMVPFNPPLLSLLIALINKDPISKLRQLGVTLASSGNP